MQKLNTMACRSQTHGVCQAKQKYQDSAQISSTSRNESSSLILSDVECYDNNLLDAQCTHTFTMNQNPTPYYGSLITKPKTVAMEMPIPPSVLSPISPKLFIEKQTAS